MPSPPPTRPASSAGSPNRVGTLRLLAAHGLRPDTELGQHFLVDENLADVAVREGDVGPDDVVLEVGAGLGTLTVALARAARVVHAIEIDRRLAAALDESLAGLGNVRLHWTDALELDLGAVDPAPTRVVANLPYAIATPLLLETLWSLPGVSRWAVMAQREVADRWLAPPGSPLYGGPSVLVQLTAAPTFTRAVGRTVFVPRPRVDSALVALRRTGAGPAPPLRSFVRAAFAQRRKTLVNALAAAGAQKAQVAELLAARGLPPSVRAQELEPATFPELAEALSWSA